VSSEQELDWLARWTLYNPNKIALKDVIANRQYSYRSAFRIANRMSFELHNKWGVRAGDRVAVFAHNRVETIFLFFALQRLGAVLVPINFRLAPAETDFVLSDSGARLLFYDPASADLTSRLRTHTECHPIETLGPLLEEGRDFTDVMPFQGEFEKACKIIYTSGTTGFPKGVVITPKILFWNSVNTTMSLDIVSSDVTVNFSPFFHTGGWNVLLTPFLHRGATTLLLPKFDAETVLRVIAEEQVTLFFGVPTTLSMMARTDDFWKTDLSRVRYAIVGGEPMPLNMIKTWHQKGVAVRQGFGMTECGPNCFSLSERDAESKIGSIGRPNFYVQTRVVDDENRDVETGQVGELLLKGPMCMTEYWQNPEATHSALVDGWLRTGDLVKRDQDDDFFVVGRKKEMFISGGENVYPAEVEKVISRHPEVDEVAVLGVEDPQWGEVGRAFVVTRSRQSVPTEDIIQFCRNEIASYKIPKQFEFLEELPKGDSGKVLKKQLKTFINNQGVN
jgi:fatty-acyl-CoA synthase